MNEEIKTWYKNTYPNDYSAWVAPNVTFSDLFKMLVHKENVYAVLGGSIEREKCFERIAELMGVEYNFVYRLWLYGTEVLG